jgi:hypothetical protein
LRGDDPSKDYKHDWDFRMSDWQDQEGNLYDDNPWSKRTGLQAKALADDTEDLAGNTNKINIRVSSLREMFIDEVAEFEHGAGAMPQDVGYNARIYAKVLGDILHIIADVAA